MQSLFYNIRLLALVLAVFCSAACQSGLSVDASVRLFGSSGAYKGQTFHVTSQESGNNLEAAQYREYATKALAHKGMVPSSKKGAEVEVRMAYSISGPRKEVVTSPVPIFGVTGVSAINTSGALAPTLNGAVSYNSTSTVTPSYGITGYTTAVRTDVWFDRYLKLEGKSATTGKNLWSIEVNSTGSSGDLNIALPFMLVAASEALDKAPGTSQNFTVFESAVSKRIFGVEK